MPLTAMISSLSLSAPHRSAGEPGLIESRKVEFGPSYPMPSPSVSSGVRRTSVTSIDLICFDMRPPPSMSFLALTIGPRRTIDNG